MMPEDIRFDKTKKYDLVMATCGYERRSSYLCRLGIVGIRKIASVYPDTIGPTFQENLSLYAAAGWEVFDLHASIQILHDAIRDGAKFIAVDVSSMPRHAIALFVEVFTSLDRDAHLEVHFLYCPGDFTGSSLAANVDQPMSADAVSPYFAGTIRPPSIPIGLIVGLGLEPHRASGIIELLEPARTWLFTPNQGDVRFVEASSRVHENLLKLFDQSDIFDYSIRSLAKTYSALESLCFSTGLHYRLILAPSGPKLFSLACLLVASKRDPARPAVWRIGNSTRGNPVSVDEAGDVSASIVKFGKQP